MSSSSGRGARGAFASTHMKRWRAATVHSGRRTSVVALLVLAMVGSLLALAVPPPSVAGAQDMISTHNEWSSSCIGRAGPGSQAQVEPLGFTVEHPASASPDSEFTFRVVPDEGYLPDKADTIVGVVTVLGLRDIKLMFNLPTNAQVQSVELVPDSTYNTAGPYSIAIDDSFSPARIVLSVGEVVKNPSLPDNSTPFKHPSFDVNVKATGPIGSNISTRVSGFNEPTSGYTFTADNSAATAQVRCWADGEVPAPVLFQTFVSSGGGVTQPTTTELAVDPTVLPAGNTVDMTATVSAPSGVVRFNDGSTVLGFAELDETSTATLTAALNTIGSRQVTAHYLGAPGFDTSSSAPVVVMVTNPANRTSVQVAVQASPDRINEAGSANTPSTNVSVSVLPTEDGGPEVTGDVRLFDSDGTSLGVASLQDGETTFAVTSAQYTLGLQGHQFRADYVGDVNYKPATGTTPFALVLNALVDFFPGVNAPLTGGAVFNGASGALTTGSILNGTFRTDGDGYQTLDGVLLFPESVLDVSGGTVSGVLAQVGPATGRIAPGADAEASLSTQLYYQVFSADLGSGEQTFASGCAIGPFPVDLSGTRMGTSGILTLSQAGFSVPFAAPGSCLNADGVSMATQVGAAFAGASTSLEITLTPRAPGAPTAISPVSVSSTSPAFGQPITLTATATPVDTATFPLRAAGTIEFYTGAQLIGSTSNLNGSNAAEITGSITIPFESTLLNIPPLPQGEHELRAMFRPNDSNKSVLASSPLSSPPTIVNVLPPVTKTTPTLTLQLPEVVGAGEPVALDLRMSPASNTFPAEFLMGEIEIIDTLTGSAIPIVGPGVSGNNQTLVVGSSSDGVFPLQTALSPGVYSLQAVFVPGLRSQWYWGIGSSEVRSHTVVGEEIPTSLTVVGDSTRGTGVVPVGALLFADVQIDPRLAASIGPAPAKTLVPNVITGHLATNTTFAASGLAAVRIEAGFHGTPGHRQIPVSFDPTYNSGNPVSSMQAFSNQGFAPSSTMIEYEAVDPAVVGPIPMGLEITGVAPNRSANPPILTASEPIPANTPWGLDGYVSYVGSGNPNGGKVDYVARNVVTDEVTALGSPGVDTTTLFGRGRTKVPSDAQSGYPAVGAAPGLPAGTYEITGTYTPNSPNRYQSTTSEPFVIRVIDPDERLDSETTLSVSPSGTSEPGAPVILEARVGPSEAVGNVEFFDGESSLGTASVSGGYASWITYDLAPGEHQLSAVFTSSSPLVEGSSSVLVPHLVADPAIGTETVLAVTPEGSSLQGDDVTLTATVTADDPGIGSPVGTVVFEDEHGEIGAAELVDGVAVVVVSDLEPGTHEIVAVYEPDPDSDFAESSSEPQSHEVIAQGAPQPPLDVTAEPGGLMAIVSWDVPEDDGGQPITGYTVYISSGEEPQEWDFPVADVGPNVTTVDVIGLEEGLDYSFKVTAWNAEGESDLSEVSNEITVGPATVEFTDVGPGDDFFNEITWMAETGLSTGYEPGPQYRPTISITRQAMSAFIYRINGSPLGDDPQCSEAPFPDVTLDNDFCGEIAWMADEGITQGNPDGTFNPTGNVTRQAMSAFLYRSANGPDAPPACTTAPFSDVPANDQFCPYISWMAEEGIANGFEDGTFGPTLPVTRMAMSAFLYRYTLVVPTTVV